ncbi:MAG: hypothetical protein J6J86_07560 [Lachnospiraceae bacterium]|nr:hypothetical protein [Lachnospiraceae bacterium]
MENISWNAFMASGRVEDYLRYKREGKYPEYEDEPQRGNASHRDETGEDAVWENPLR